MIELRFLAGHQGRPLVEVSPPYELLGVLLGGVGYPLDSWPLTTLRDGMRAVLTGERERYVDGYNDVLVEVDRENARITFDLADPCVIPTADCLAALERWRAHLASLIRGVGSVRGVLRHPLGTLPAETVWQAEVYLEQRAADCYFVRGEMRGAKGFVGQFGILVSSPQGPDESGLYEQAMEAVVGHINHLRGRHGPVHQKLLYRVTGSEWISKGTA